jgi:hypothetical protein
MYGVPQAPLLLKPIMCLYIVLDINEFVKKFMRTDDVIFSRSSRGSVNRLVYERYFGQIVGGVENNL